MRGTERCRTEREATQALKYSFQLSTTAAVHHRPTNNRLMTTRDYPGRRACSRALDAASSRPRIRLAGPKQQPPCRSPWTGQSPQRSSYTARGAGRLIWAHRLGDDETPGRERTLSLTAESNTGEDAEGEGVDILSNSLSLLGAPLGARLSGRSLGRESVGQGGHEQHLVDRTGNRPPRRKHGSKRRPSGASVCLTGGIEKQENTAHIGGVFQVWSIRLCIFRQVGKRPRPVCMFINNGRP